MSSISSRILGFFKPKQQQQQQQQPSPSSSSQPGVTNKLNDGTGDIDLVMVDQGSVVERMTSSNDDSGSRVTQEIKVSGEGISLVVEVQGSSAAGRGGGGGGGGVVQDTGSGFLVVSKENSTSTTCEVRERNNGTHDEISLPQNGEQKLSADGVEGLAEMRVEGEKKEVGGKVEGMGDQVDHGFSVGDFVWGRTKNQLWWPGQIYNPSDASKYAAKLQQRNQLLVAFFGNQSYGWCPPSELKPFLQNFEEMLLQSKSKRLHSAVEEALNEIGRIVESEMTCSCVPMEAKIGLVRPLAVNPGIKGGVVVPDCGIDDFLITHFQPAKFLAVLRYIAQVVAPTNMLELTVFRRQLSAFNRSRGCRQLPMYQLIPQDNDENGVASRDDFNGKTGDSNSSPPEEDWLASPKIRGFRKGSKEKWPGISEDKLYQRKKHRTMVDIMAGEMDVESENCESDAAEEENIGKPMSASRKRKKNEVETEGGLAEDDFGSGNSVSPSKKKKETKISESPSELAKQRESNAGSADVGGGDENISRSLTRERKKSKYLSPPYTSLGAGSKNWVYPSDSATETPKVSRVGDKMRKAVDQLSGSPPIVKCSSETSQKKSEESISYQRSGKKSFVYKLTSGEMFFELLTAALDPMYLKENSSSGSVKSFFSRYRNSLYLEGMHHIQFNNFLAVHCDEKGNLIDHKNSSPGKDPHETDHPTSNDKSEPMKTELKDDKMLQSSNNEPKRIKRKYEKKSHRPDSEPKRIKDKDEKLPQTPNSEPKKIKRKYEKKLQSPNSEPNRIKRKYEKKLQSPNGEPRRNKKKDENPQSPNCKPKRSKSKGEKMSQGPNSEPGTVDIKQNQVNGETSGAALLVNFASGVSLPSKSDLVTVFGKFGPLNESETEVLQESGCAQVVYTRSSDAEAAFNSSEKSSPFGPPDLVSYRLRYLTTTSKASENFGSSSQPLPGLSEQDKNSHQPLPTPTELKETTPHTTVSEVPPLQFVRQKLQMMTSMLEKSGDDISPEVKAKLESEITGLLKKVTTKGDSSSS